MNHFIAHLDDAARRGPLAEDNPGVGLSERPLEHVRGHVVCDGSKVSFVGAADAS